jgi:hypothetical protein
VGRIQIEIDMVSEIPVIICPRPWDVDMKALINLEIDLILIQVADPIRKHFPRQNGSTPRAYWGAV